MNPEHTQALELVASDDRNVAARLAALAGISRQAASARLLRAVNAGLLIRAGHGAGVRYALATQRKVDERFPREGLAEDRVWRQHLSPIVADLPDNVRSIWHYGMTEMINNAVDHSRSETVHVTMSRNALYTQATVADGGEGIFLRVQKALGLFDPSEAILELAKGKFTTDPANHSGEGIFFASKVFDAFEIRSGNLHFTHGQGLPDVRPERPLDAPGTVVLMRLANGATRTIKEVFDQYAAPEEFSFARTVVPVRLAQHEGERLISRSQAKRFTMRFERFQTVVLDFADVAEIGQGFADEVFRVFQNAHPGIALQPIHMTEAVQAMVGRAKGVR